MSELRNIRRALGLTQDVLAVAMNTTGVSISRYERDERKLTLPLLRRLSVVLKCSISDIIGDDQDTALARVNRPEVRWVSHHRLDQYQQLEGSQKSENSATPEMPINEQWLQSLEAAGGGEIVVVEVANCGDAMSPKLNDGDFVLVDQSIRTFVRDGMYLILSGSQPEFRRLAKNPVSQCYSILSENPVHPDYHNVPLEKLIILGLAVWRCCST
jgi:transcriptional regulator with XRE-family HTH domain